MYSISDPKILAIHEINQCLYNWLRISHNQKYKLLRKRTMGQIRTMVLIVVDIDIAGIQKKEVWQALGYDEDQDFYRRHLGLSLNDIYEAIRYIHDCVKRDKPIDYNKHAMRLDDGSA